MKIKEKIENYENYKMNANEDEITKLLLELHTFYFRQLDEIDVGLDEELKNVSHRTYQFIKLNAFIEMLEVIMLQYFGGKQFFEIFIKSRDPEFEIKDTDFTD